MKSCPENTAPASSIWIHSKMLELTACCVPGGRALWYFDSFGMGFPQEFKSSKPVIWNSSQFQNIRSVLCGYYCLYFLHQWAQGKDFYDILKPFSLTDTMQNEKFIKEYFY